MKKKLIVRVKGGLGNQLFCYSAARRLAFINSAEIVIDDLSGFSRDFLYKRQYRLGGFSIPARIASPRERFEPAERIRRGIKKFIQKFHAFEKRSYIMQEFDDFDARLLDLELSSPITTIDGLWQSANYFKDIEALLRKELAIKQPCDDRNLSAKDWIKSHQAVCIHVRRFSSAESDVNVNALYYKMALDAIFEKILDPYFVVFSDDIKAAVALLDLPESRCLVVDWNLFEGGELNDLWLMSNCEHFIIANSTFSWWGAWLGARKSNQLIFFPRRHKNNVLHWSWDYRGQMPDSWIPILI